jgi:hypothetical protein
VEQQVNDITLDETIRAIKRLKNWKAPGSDGIPAELIKYGGIELHKTIYELCKRIWNEEKLPEEWNKAIVIPLYKKGDKMSCNNYRGISLLNTAYKVFSKVLLGRLEPLAEECIGSYQCGFRKGKSTIDQLATIEQLMEKKYEYRQKIWQVFVDFKKAYDSIHRDSLYNIMYEFGFPKKLISLTKMCMNGTRYQVRVDCTVSEEFEVMTGLKQGDALSPILFNIALEKVIRSVQSNKLGINIGKTTLDVLGFADDLNLVGENKEMIVRNTKTLIHEAKKIGLEINEEKTKVMETLAGRGGEDLTVDNYVFEKAQSFKYLGVTITGNNDWSAEITSRLLKAERAFFALIKYFKSKLFSRGTKVRLYMSIVRPTLTYGCEVWPMTVQIEQKLRSFENKVLRTICGPVFDTAINRWRRRKNAEIREITKVPYITSYVKGQRIQWFGHTMRRDETNEVRASIEYKPTGRRPRGRPKKRWMDGVRQDLERLEVTDWVERIQDRSYWRLVTVAAKTLTEL